MNSFVVETKLFPVMARTKDFDEEEVLTRAMNLFWSRGYNTTSMEDLVSGLGISRSSLYDTYTDKHSLFIKALENYQQIGFEKMQETASHPGPAKETVKKLLEQVHDGLLTGRHQKGCFMMNAAVEVAPHDKTVNNMVLRNDQQMEDIFYQVIQRGKNNGEIKNQRGARALAKFFFNTVKGMQVTAKSNSDKSVFDDIIKLAVSILDHTS
jgi:TetR/AcrR family transcriptional regulator, transcriptional repressor for nem operon